MPLFLGEVGRNSLLAGWLLIMALAEPHLEVVSRQKAPAIGTIAEVTPKSQHGNIERRGCLQISNGENTTGIDDTVHVRTPAQSTSCPANDMDIDRPNHRMPTISYTFTVLHSSIALALFA